MEASPISQDIPRLIAILTGKFHLRQKDEAQKSLEGLIILGFGCTVRPISISMVNFAAMGNEILNFSHSEGIKCITETITEDLYHIRNWLVLKNMVGKESREGIVFRVNIVKLTGNPLFVIKAQKNREDFSLLHETAVCYYCLNSIRKLGIPNFVYIYKTFQCNGPVVDEKEVVTWCSKDTNPVTHIIEENVNGPTLDDLIAKLSVEDFELIMWQILNALKLAYHRCGFIHNDLHLGNIVVRLMETPHAIPCYSRDDVTGYIISRYVPVIIDYGYCQYNFKHEGQSVTIGGTRTSPAADIYKFLTRAANYAFYSENMAVYGYIRERLQFFGIEAENLTIMIMGRRIPHFRPNPNYDLIFDHPLFTIKTVFPKPEGISTVLATDTSNMVIEFYDSLESISSLFEYCYAWEIVGIIKLVDPDAFRANLRKIGEAIAVRLMDETIAKFTNLVESIRDLNGRLEIFDPNDPASMGDRRRIAYLSVKVSDLIFQAESYIKSMECALKYAGSDFIEQYVGKVAGFQNMIDQQRGLYSRTHYKLRRTGVLNLLERRF